MPITNTSTPATNFGTSSNGAMVFNTGVNTSPTATPLNLGNLAPKPAIVGPTVPATKPLDQMTVAEAAAAGKTTEYNALVQSKLSGMSGVQPGSTIDTLSKVPNSAAGVPSSSATVVAGANGQTAINGTTTTPTTPDDPNVALGSYYTDKLGLSQYGLSITANDIKMAGGIDQAVTIAQSQKAQKQAQIDNQNNLNAEAQSKAADLAQNDAELAAATNKLNQQMANLSKMGLSSSGDESQGFNQASNQQYVTSQSNFMLNQLIQNANAKAAAIKSGDMKAVAQINANYEQIIAEGTNKLSTDLASQNQNAAARKAQADTLALNAQTKNQTIADKELQTIPTPLADQLTGLPNDYSSLSASQKQTLTGTPGYNSLISSGMSPQDALGYIKSAAAGNKQQTATDKLAIQTATAQLNNTLTQGKILVQQEQANNISTLASLGGGVYATAFNNAQLDGNYAPTKVKASLETLAGYASSGDTQNLKDGIASFALSGTPANTTMFTGLRAMSSTFDRIAAEIKTLPKDQQTGIWNGNVNNLASKFGASDDPRLQALGTELKHLGVYYGQVLGGIRGAVSAAGNANSTFSKLVPDINDQSGLILSNMQGFKNTASDLIDGTLQTKIGADQFTKIYGDSYLGKSTGGSSSSSTGGTSGTTYDWSSAINSFWTGFSNK
jgi:hypothetical protein